MIEQGNSQIQKVALITGASRGLGLATARQLAEIGAKVIVGARDGAAGDRVVADFRAEGLDAEPVVLDVNSIASVRAAAEQVDERHGRLDILVNSAGILPEATEGDSAKPIDVELFEKTFATNLFGPVAVVQEFLPLLERSQAGRIVNVSSTMGSLADQLNPDSPYHGVVVPGYQGSKAALNGLTIALAKLLAETPIKVNSVCPGWLKTDLGGADNRAAAPMSADEGARIVVEMACVGPEGPSGQFVDRDGVVAW